MVYSPLQSESFTWSEAFTNQNPVGTDCKFAPTGRHRRLVQNLRLYFSDGRATSNLVFVPMKDIFCNEVSPALVSSTIPYSISL